MKLNIIFKKNVELYICRELFIFFNLFYYLVKITRTTFKLELSSIRNEKRRWLIRKEGSVLFNSALSTFHLRSCGVEHMVKNHSGKERETLCRHYMSYSFRLAARNLVHAPSHRQSSTYHGIFLIQVCCALAGKGNIP